MPRNELFLGNLSRDVQRRDIEHIFDKYGRIERCDIKSRGSYFNSFQHRLFKSVQLIYLIFFKVMDLSMLSWNSKTKETLRFEQILNC